MELTRRGFFKLGVLTGTAATLPKWVQKALPGGMFRTQVEPPRLHGEERWVPTVCGQCAAGCGLLVRVIEGKAVGVQGNPKHPVNRGALCPKGLACLQELYHPDRLQAPLKRVGARGAGKWEKVSWEAALGTVASELRRLRDAPQEFAIVIGEVSFLMRDLWRRFAQAFGTPNVVELSWTMGAGPVDAAAAMMGAERIIYDLERANFVLSLGADWLQSSPSPVEASRAYGTLRRGRVGRRARVVSAEPRLSVTAAKADEWIPLQPNTEGALALGIAHVLIAEGLYDRDFVEQHTVGFDDFKTLVLRDYAPAKVAGVTGVPAETITRLAHDFAAHKPAVALCDRVRLHDQMAVLALNALVGSIARTGGVRPAPAVPLSPVLSSSLIPHPSSLIPSGVKALLLHRANPLFTSPASEGWKRAIEGIPFIVSITSFMDETAQQADVVLPESCALEAWEGVPTASWDGVPVFGVAQPVVNPLYDTRHAGDILLPLAKALLLESAFPWKQFTDLLREAAQATFESGRGEAMGELAAWQEEEGEGGKTEGEKSDSWMSSGEEKKSDEGSWMSGGDEASRQVGTAKSDEGSWMNEGKEKKSDGDSWMSGGKEEKSDGDSWMSGGEKKKKTTFAQFWRTISRTGGWVDRAAEVGNGHRAVPTDTLATPSGKFEFSAERLQSLIPHPSSLIPYAGNAADYPLRLVVYTPLVFAGGTGAHLPYLQGVGGAHIGERWWESRAEIHPQTARGLGIADEDWVWVESPAGKVRLRAKVTPRALPDVVNIAFGLGHTACGRWAEGIGVNPAALLAHRRDEVTGHPLWNLTRVRVTKAATEVNR